MKALILSVVLFGIKLSQISCNFEIPEEFRDARDALDSEYYKETLEQFFRDQTFPENERGGRIAGGAKAYLGQFPYHALLYLTDNSNSRFICGGVLIKYNLVLTAAHCIEGFIQIDVFLGVVDRINGPTAWHSGPITNRKFLISHPKFEARLLRNDIGLVFLENASESLLDHEHIELVNLPTFDEATTNLTGMMSTLSGFGVTEDGKASKVLKFTDLEIISNEQCFQTFSGLIIFSTLCTATSSRGSPCQGDSGGPLTVQLNPTRQIVVGLTSFGSKHGCTLGYPVAFQRVANHLTWLDDYMTNSEGEIDVANTTPSDNGSMTGLNVKFEILLLILVISKLIRMIIMK